MKVKIKVWYVSYSTKDGPFFSEQDASTFNGGTHGGWGEVTTGVAEAELDTTDERGQLFG